MSRQPSPGPSQQLPSQTHYRDNTTPSNFHDASVPPQPQPFPGEGHHGAAQVGIKSERVATSSGAAPAVSAPVMSTRTRSKAYQSGIAAGAEDVKYAAKYRDLKVKVREIEAENDRLFFKIKQAMRNIQRAKIERAILYERLSKLPASPLVPNANLPPSAPSMSAGGPRGAPVPSRHAPPPPPAQQASHSSRRNIAPAGAPYGPTHHQPIAPAPANSPPLAHPPPPGAGHGGALPITHAQQVITVDTPDGPLVVVAGPNGRPVYTHDGMLIPAEAPPVPPAPAPRRRGRARERDPVETERTREHALHVQMPEQPLSAGGGHGDSSHVPYWMDETRRRTWEREQDTGGPPPPQSGGRHYRQHGHGSHGREHSVGSPPPPGSAPALSSTQTSPIDTQPMRSSHYTYPIHGHGHGHHHSHSHSHSHSTSPHSPTGGHAAASYPSQRMHYHQRIGPGSNVIRERERRDRDAGEPTEAPMPAAPSEEASAAPTPTPVSRVPTPPYMRRTTASREAEQLPATERENASQGPPEAYAEHASEHARSRSNSRTPN